MRTLPSRRVDELLFEAIDPTLLTNTRFKMPELQAKSFYDYQYIVGKKRLTQACIRVNMEQVTTGVKIWITTRPAVIVEFQPDFDRVLLHALKEHAEIHRAIIADELKAIRKQTRDEISESEVVQWSHTKGPSTELRLNGRF